VVGKRSDVHSSMRVLRMPADKETKSARRKKVAILDIIVEMLYTFHDFFVTMERPVIRKGCKNEAI
jgi:hypothetical protein